MEHPVDHQDRHRAAIITVSDSRSGAGAHDATTPLLTEALEAAGWVLARAVLVPDDAGAIAAAIIDCCRADIALVATSGGTGLGPRDVTPEATIAVVERLVPGIGELLRAEGARQTGMSWLSRGVAGTRGRTLVVNLPGSPKGALQGLDLVLPLAGHARHVMHGGGHG